jgi:hypothetical protein
MLRHLDAAWEHRGGRRLYGLFIVEAEKETATVEASPAWHEAVELTVSDEVLKGSLPHRSPDERSQIAGALLGVTTWRAICAEFQIPREVLISEVFDDRPPPKTTRETSVKALGPAALPADVDHAESARNVAGSAPT